MPAGSLSLHEAAAQCGLDHLARPEEGLGRRRAPAALQAPLLSSMHPHVRCTLTPADRTSSECTWNYKLLVRAPAQILVVVVLVGCTAKWPNA